MIRHICRAIPRRSRQEADNQYVYHVCGGYINDITNKWKKYMRITKRRHEQQLLIYLI